MNTRNQWKSGYTVAQLLGMKAIERALYTSAEKGCSRQDLQKEVFAAMSADRGKKKEKEEEKEVSARRVQQLLAELIGGYETIYGEGYQTNREARGRWITTSASRDVEDGPRYHLIRPQSLVFPEIVLEEDPRLDTLATLMSMSAFYGLPVRKMLEKASRRVEEEPVPGELYGLPLDRDTERRFIALNSAISRHQVVQVTYNGQPKILSPLALVRQNGKWLLLAHVNEVGAWRWSTFGIDADRMDVEINDYKGREHGEFVEVPAREIQAYYDRFVDFFTPDEVKRDPEDRSMNPDNIITHDVAFTVTDPATLNYIRWNPIHRRQRISSDGRVEIKGIAVTRSLAQRLLSRAPAVTDVRPAKLRLMMLDMARAQVHELETDL